MLEVGRTNDFSESTMRSNVWQLENVRLRGSVGVGIISSDSIRILFPPLPLCPSLLSTFPPSSSLRREKGGGSEGAEGTEGSGERQRSLELLGMGAAATLATGRLDLRGKAINYELLVGHIKIHGSYSLGKVGSSRNVRRFFLPLCPPLLPGPTCVVYD